MPAKRIALGFGIAIILPLLVYYGVSMISPGPKWEDYSLKGSWTDYRDMSKEEQKKMEKERENLTKKYQQEEIRFQRWLFYSASPIGVAAIIAGAFAPIPAIGTGLMFGGIFTVTEAYVFYWGEIQPQLKFFSLLVSFIVLLVVGYKKLGS